METKFTRIVPPSSRGRAHADHSVSVCRDVITLRIGLNFAGTRATFESDGNGTLRIVFAETGDYKVASWGAIKSSVRIASRRIIDHLGLKPGRYQGRMEGNALYLNLNEMVRS